MTIEIAIVGLGQIGASVGLALAEHTDLVHRVGHDRELGNSQRAKEMGALDGVTINLLSAVRSADIVLLSLPIDQLRETITHIAPELKEGAVVMDTGPVKEIVAAWAGELLPQGRYYVGLTPVLNPAYLHEHETGLKAAHADLFRSGLIAIVAPPRTPSAPIKLAADLARLLGADPLFFDPVEVDSLMAATHILPQLVSAALLSATVDQPGWREGRKIAGRAYAETTGAASLLGEPEALTSSALLNRENVLRWMDGLIAALNHLRADLYAQDAQALEARLQRARSGRETWWQQRQAANWQGEENAPAVEAPTGSEVFGRLLGLGQRKKPKNHQ
jgi:prephenate dehydrogenase